jgi:hypothetical protein
MLNFVYLRSSRLHFLHFLTWFIHCQQEGQVWACFDLPHVFRRFPSGFELVLSSCSSQFFPSGHRPDRWNAPVWPVWVSGAGRSSAPVWPVQSTGLTGQSKAEAAALFCDVVCMHSSRGSWIGSGGACMSAGGAGCGFRALVWWFVLFAWACVRHGYPWVPTGQAHGRPWQVGPAFQKTRRPVCGPNRPSWRPTQPPEDLPEDSPEDLVQTRR